MCRRMRAARLIWRRKLAHQTATMNSPDSSSDSASFNLLDGRIKRWIWEAGWTGLREAQERAIPVILEGKRDVIIAASTASGKTEAAFFPILTQFLTEAGPA